jgi:hypothetical protein
MLYIFYDLNFIFTKAKVFEVSKWASINMDFIFLIHGFYYNLTNVVRLKIQFNIRTWTLCGLFLSKNEPLISAYTMKRKSGLIG